MSEKPKKPRGFAAMDPARRQELARKGGASVKAENRSFAKDRDLARRAGGASKRPKEGP